MSDESREQGRHAEAATGGSRIGHPVPSYPGPAAHGQPTPGQAASEPAGSEQAAPGQAAPEQAGSEQPRSEQAAFGQPASGPAAFGQAGFGQAGFGQAGFGQAGFGQAGFGQPGWASGSADPSAGAHHGQPGPGPVDGHFPPPPGHFSGPPTATLPSQPRKQRTMTGIVTAALVAGLVGGAAGFGGAYAVLGDSGSAPTLTSSPQSADAINAAPGSVVAAAQTVLPSTVDIRAVVPQGVSEGSGVILTAEGDVLTNNHVVGGSREITVTLADGSEHPATVVGTSPSYDLAVIRVQGASGLTPAELGESSSLQVGQPVVAIGSPRGLTGTVTSGIVSAFNRTVQVPGEDGTAVVYNGLQTDTPINQGNSGGPLVNLNGQVIGINSAIATGGGESTGNIGLGFAIPIDQARRVAQEIMDTGTATKPLLGVQGSTAATGQDGAPIAAVQPGTPAEAAGLQPGDVVTRVDDARVEGFADLIARIGAHAPGEQVTLTITNGGTERTVDVTLAGQPDQGATTSDGGQSRTPFGGGSPFGGNGGNPFGGN
jgi:putative serine protease PepD